MNVAQYIETIYYLKTKQLFYQVLARIFHKKYKEKISPANLKVVSIIPPINKPQCLIYNKKAIDSTTEATVSFLNISDTFSSWDQKKHGMLWAYNLNYMDWLCQKGISEHVCTQWIDKFIRDLHKNQIGLAPYPTALRTINWMKFFSLHPSCRNKKYDTSLYSQTLFLSKNIEYKLLGNHLLEDTFSLFIASIYFQDKKLYRSSSKILKEQLQEQILDDGAHFEQSPMYHCILLDRLLDSINFSSNNIIWESQENFNKILLSKAILMLGHLSTITFKDDCIPLLNDSAYGIAPHTKNLFEYAKSLKISWEPIPLKSCGYRKLQNPQFEAIIDIGNITASYQPGHSHADTFNYELRIDGVPFVIDTGLSTYNKNDRRQYERSTIAHNTVSVDSKDSSRVWGGFRVGKRCKVSIELDQSTIIKASHNGFKKKCQRTFQLTSNEFVVEDYYDGDAVSYIHLPANAEESRIRVEGATYIEVEQGKYATEYNNLLDCKVIKLHFNGRLKYSIQ